MKSLDLVVFGATGFTGKLAVDYLASKSPEFHSTFKWAIAGRSAPRLNTVRSELLAQYPYLAESKLPEVLEADSKDQEALDKVTEISKAVVSFVGPFRNYGTPLVASCVKNKCHYADITGEITWIKQIIDKFDDEAKRNEVILVPACGFDSVPSDWGTYALNEYFKEKLNEPVGPVKNCVWLLRMQPSAGTISTIFESRAPQNIAGTSKMLQEPQYLVPVKSKRIREIMDLRSATWDSDLYCWAGPFFMASVNTRNVNRSAALNAYGDNFTYLEFMRFTSWFKAFITAWTVYIRSFFFSNPWTRPIVAKFLPKSGTGSSNEEMKNGYLHLKLIGQSENTGKRAQCDLIVNGDPGYSMTARMAVEAGIDLALRSDEKKLHGFLTPSSGLGKSYFDELLKVGFEIDTRMIKGQGHHMQNGTIPGDPTILKPPELPPHFPRM